MPKWVIVLLIGLGFGGVSVALGYLYKDFTHREGAWAELQFSPPATQAERQKVLDAWRDIEGFEASLVSGTIGVMLLGMGVAGAVLRLRWFNAETENA